MINTAIYRSNFLTSIGHIYYIWGNYCPEDGNINSTSNVFIYFLSNSRKSFDAYIAKIKVNFPELVILEKGSKVIESEVKSYLEKKLKDFSIKPAFLSCSLLQRKIWETTMRIPYGKVASYKELAESAGYPNAWRAAGTAISKNPVMIVVPCHRIIKSDGSIGLYGGGEKVKEFLLDLEQD